VKWAKRAETLGAGEIFLTSIDQDGTQSGYDLDLISAVSEAVSVPVIASGGVGIWKHLVEGVVEGGADAVSVANRLHHVQHSTKKAKEYMKSAGIDVREPSFAERYDL
jgi:cyclase